MLWVQTERGSMIKVLEKSNLEMYQQFSLGLCAVKYCSDWFCRIRCNIELEQTIQKVLRGPRSHFVAGETHKEKSLTKFELLFHKLVAIRNLFQPMTSKENDNGAQCNSGNNSAPTKNILFNKHVVKLTDFIKKRMSTSFYFTRYCNSTVFSRKYFTKHLGQNEKR